MGNSEFKNSGNENSSTYLVDRLLFISSEKAMAPALVVMLALKMFEFFDFSKCSNFEMFEPGQHVAHRGHPAPPLLLVLQLVIVRHNGKFNKGGLWENHIQEYSCYVAGYGIFRNKEYVLSPG